MKSDNARANAKEAAIPEIAKIDQAIIEASKKGLTRMAIRNISQGAIAYLEDEGFKITEINYPGTFSQIIINW